MRPRSALLRNLARDVSRGAAALTFLILLCEGTLRLFVQERVLAIPHPVSFATRLASSSGVWISPRGEFSQTIHFNSLALRGPEPDRSIPRQILFLGDSMIEALQVPEEETVCDLLTKRLGRDVAVINAGMGGYCPVLESLRLPELFDAYNPRVVLVGLFPNDLEEEYGYRRMAVTDINGEPQAVCPPVLRSETGRFMVSLFRVSTIWRVLQRGFSNATAARPHEGKPDAQSMDVINPFRRDWAVAERTSWRGISNSLARIRDLCVARGSRLIVVVIPAGQQLGPGVWKEGKLEIGYRPDEWEESTAFQEEAAARAHRLGLEVIDLLPSFRNAANAADLYYPFDGHWTPLGHQAAAECILSLLQWRKGTVDGR